MIIDEITERVIACCFKVHKALGSGFLEKVYENALVIELFNSGMYVQQQVPITVKYEGKAVGEYFADIVIGDKIICELKANEHLSKDHETQLVHYLAATGRDIGLLINFGRSVAVRRKYREFRDTRSVLTSAPSDVV